MQRGDEGDKPTHGGRYMYFSDENPVNALSGMAVNSMAERVLG